jgi:hypothetical protein
MKEQSNRKTAAPKSRKLNLKDYAFRIDREGRGAGESLDFYARGFFRAWIDVAGFHYSQPVEAQREVSAA